MKTTGIVRKVDHFGRIVLPIKLRKTLGFHLQDTLEIYVDGDYIVLEHFDPRCFFCGEGGPLLSYRGKNVCVPCAGELGTGAAARG